jgi:hypothetical protein
LFDTNNEYDLCDEPTSDSTKKSEKSFAETVAEFGLLEKNENLPTKGAVPQSHNVGRAKTPPISGKSSLNRNSKSCSTLRSPERSIMVKVQPSKGVKKNMDISVNEHSVSSDHTKNGWSRDFYSLSHNKCLLLY